MRRSIATMRRENGRLGVAVGLGILLGMAVGGCSHRPADMASVQVAVRAKLEVRGSWTLIEWATPDKPGDLQLKPDTALILHCMHRTPDGDARVWLHLKRNPPHWRAGVWPKGAGHVFLDFHPDGTLDRNPEGRPLTQEEWEQVPFAAELLQMVLACMPPSQ